MKRNLFWLVALVACALAMSMDAPAVHAAKKKKSRDASKPVPAAKAPPVQASTPDGKPVPAKVEPAQGAKPDVPTGGRTTIAPFPVPGDTGRDAAERRKLLNVPKPGVTTLVPAPGLSTGPASIAGDTSALPMFGDYVFVEELPEAIDRAFPIYPEAARKAGVQGTVMVQALVARDGSVADVRIVKSIPALDDAAAAAVRQWRFKPAMAKGQPVAVWVGVPVKFALH